MDQPSSTESNAITLRIRFKSASLDEFIGRYGADVSPGGLFIRTKQPVEVGTSLQFDFSLADGSPLLSGMGTVAWVRESDPARANNVPGMGLRFDKLTAESQHTHQLILAEKARKEGKASATPYPPTAFVAPPARFSPAPEGSKPGEALARVEPGPAVSTITRPAPATAMKTATPSPAARPVASPLSGVVQSAGNFSDTDEFAEAGKTEVSEKPLDYYLKEAEAAKADHGRRQESKTAEEAVPQSLLDEVSAGSPLAPITRSGPPPEGFAAEEPAPDAAGPGDAMPLADDGPRGGSGASMDLGGEGEAEPVAVPSGEIMPELSAGAPIEETPPEKTEEVAAQSASLPLGDVEPLRGPEPLDLGTGREINFGDERPPSRDAGPTLRRKSGSGTIALVAIAAAAAAFAVVYLAKARPWQSQAPKAGATTTERLTAPEPAGAVKPQPAAEPAAEPPKPAEAAKPALAAKPEPEAVKPNEVAKPAVAEQAPSQKPGAEEVKPAAVVAEEKAGKPDEKEAAKVEKAEKTEKAEKAEKVERSGKAEKESGKSARSGKSLKWDDQAPGEQDVFRLVVRSTPISAEVLIDGEYFSRTPCERRILDPTKPFAVVIRKDGYEPQERQVGPSDNWAKKGEERVFAITASLKRMKHPAVGAIPTEPASDLKPERKPEVLVPKAEAAPSEPIKPEAAKAPAKEPAKTEPAPEKPEPVKPQVKAETPKPAATGDKPASKPAPDFEDPAKAK